MMAVLLSIAAVLSGCGKSQPTPVAETARDRKGGETEAEKCRKKLAGAIRRLAPETYSLQPDPERSVNGLNGWIASCAGPDLEALQLSDEAQQMLEQNPRATAPRFTGADGVYIRDCLLLRELTTNLEEREAQKMNQLGGRNPTR
ncbi:MAG: hypothetical protein R3C49_25155 [Planctomycetaceae bacterium]